MSDMRFEGPQQVFNVYQQQPDGTHAKVMMLPADLFTGGNDVARRLRVDVGQTGFFAGRSFRTFYDFTLAAGASVALKFVTPVDTVIEGLGFQTDASNVRMYALAGDAVEAGVFNVALPTVGANRMAARPQPYYTAQAGFTRGGTLTGGTVLDVLHVKTSNQSNSSSTEATIAAGERGIAAGTYYVLLQNTGADSAAILFKCRWEERP